MLFEPVRVGVRRTEDDIESHYALLVTEGGQISKDNVFQNLSVII